MPEFCQKMRPGRGKMMKQWTMRVPKSGKNGLHLSATLLKSYGFNEGDAFKFTAPETGKIVLEKISN